MKSSWEQACRDAWVYREEDSGISHCSRCGKQIFDERDEYEDDCGNVICQRCYEYMEEE